MELKDLPTSVMMIVIIGIILGVGIIILDQFGDAVKQSTTIVNETVTTSSGTGTTANDDVTALTRLINLTHMLIDGNESTSNEVNVTTTGFAISANHDGVWNASYTYDGDSHGTTAVFSARNATDDFATWLPIIVIILSAAILLGLVKMQFNT